jgi:leucyl aminopeptidase
LLGAGKPRAAAAAQTAVARAAVLVDEVHWARDLVNTAPNVLFPESFAERVRDRAPKSVAVHTYDAAALAELGCGGILGVGQGSVHPPVIVRMSYAPKGATSRLAYVGKGITFDSGGLSLKTPTGMITMKGDMGGAAAVAAAVLTIARLGLPVAVDGWLCLAENMPDGRAQRPGDVVTMADGTTCEIINTDAEGRLVLSRRPGARLPRTAGRPRRHRHPHRVGRRRAGPPDGRRAGERRRAAGGADGGRDRRRGVGVAHADPRRAHEEPEVGRRGRKHSAERQGGALFAAAFLREYVGPGADSRAIPWGHLDIAGPAYNEKGAHGYTGKGGTGFGTRTLVALAEFRS